MQFVRYWLHAEFLLINAGKMSKSAGAAKQSATWARGVRR